MDAALVTKNCQAMEESMISSRTSRETIHQESMPGEECEMEDAEDRKMFQHNLQLSTAECKSFCQILAQCHQVFHLEDEREESDLCITAKKF